VQHRIKFKDRQMGKRPEHVKPPAYLSKSPPVPEPGEAKPGPEADPADGPARLDPVRYGDWELKGIAIDF
jgi:hypothetical protein